FRESTRGENEEFWGVHRLDEDIIFVSFANLYVQRGEQLTKIAAPYRFSQSFFVAGKLYLADEKYGLYEFNGMSLEARFAYPAGGPFRIVGVTQQAEGLLITTRDDGQFAFREGRLLPVDNEVMPYLKRDQVFSFAAIDDTHYAFGTILNGVYITDQDGRIIQHINKQKGLPNNTVLALHYRGRGRLWLSMDFGVAAVHLGSDLAYVLDYRGEFGTGYTAFLRGDDFYLGTNQGLYRTTWERLQNDAREENLILMPESAGQVWALEEINGQLLCGHDRGLFRVTESSLAPIHPGQGILAIEPLDENHLLAGTYDGVALYARQGDSWRYERKMEPLLGACAELEVTDPTKMWVHIPNYGIIRATLDANKVVTDQQIFPTGDFAGGAPQLCQEENRIVVRTATKRYEYEPGRGTFSTGETTVETRQIHNLLPGVYQLKALDTTYHFAPVYNGFALQHSGHSLPSKPDFIPLIRAAEAFNNDTTYRLTLGEEVAYTLNNFRMRFRVPQREMVRYQYRLEGHQDDWSSLSARTTGEFLDLPAGDYVFQVRAEVGGEMTAPRSFAFAVAPPWYGSWWAVAGYLMLVALTLLLNYRWQRSRLQIQREDLLEQEQEALRRQAEDYRQETLVVKLTGLEEELLDSKRQLRLKTIELAKKARESEEKTRLLRTIRARIKSLEGQADAAKFHWPRLGQLLEESLETEDGRSNEQFIFRPTTHFLWSL
ncbi:MAG: triple tyrosine motif-containing protein, partial [Bacteroidota bacterium]